VLQVVRRVEPQHAELVAFLAKALIVSLVLASVRVS
jgi:hypothetical protein